MRRKRILTVLLALTLAFIWGNSLLSREVSGAISDSVMELMNRRAEMLGLGSDYFTYMARGKSDMVIFSRYPIVNQKTIEFDESNQSAMWADIDVNGQIIRFVNVHLETTGFNRVLHKAAKQSQMPGTNIENNRLLQAIYGKYTMGMVVRAEQAQTIKAQLDAEKNDDYPVVICGDFNDVPYSYTYNTMLGDLVDGFKECGSGWMYTYRGNKKVRIDYIFHDEALKGLTYYRQDLSYSDHYPVYMKVEY